MGSFVWDVIHGRDPRDAPVEEWGGITYALGALDTLERLAVRLGIASGVQVVAYDQENGMFASRLWWLESMETMPPIHAR